MGLFRKMQEIEKRYKLEKIQETTKLDNEQIDNYFQAGIDFLVEKGVYCVETHRAIQLTEQEIKDGLRLIPETDGNGRWQGSSNGEKTTVGWRQEHPCHWRRLAPAHSRRYHTLCAHDIPREYHGVEFMEGFTFKEVDGYEVYGPAIEAYAAKREIAWMRKGSERRESQICACSTTPSIP